MTEALGGLFEGRRIIDALLFPPNDYTQLKIIEDDLKLPLNQEVIIDVMVLNHEPSFKISRKTPYKITVETNDGEPIKMLFFAGNAQMWKSILKESQKYSILCKVEKAGQGFVTIHPKILKSIESIRNIKEGEAIFPRYPLTGFLSQIKVREFIRKQLQFIEDFKDEWLPSSRSLLPFKKAVEFLHSPPDIKTAEKARKRLAYDELLAKNLAFLIANSKSIKTNSPKIKLNQNFISKILEVLPFELTEDQFSAMEQIFTLQSLETPNTLLLQGDVGSGKTIVAILAAMNAVFSGFQVAVMSPTSILARQTFEVFLQILKDFNIETILLTGEDKGRRRQAKLAKIANGEAQIIVGTHALFSSDVIFSQLGYVIIDEQHRFGINQRLELTAKSSGAKTLLMSATPIPRTLSMALYGDIEIAYIKSKPKNRKDIITKLFTEEKIPEIIEAIKRKIANNEQVYWVVPLIEEGEEEDLPAKSKKGPKKHNGTSIEKRFESLNIHFFEHEIAFIHGKMKETEIAYQMERFIRGEIKLILATTVIEVGVNVPNATLMIIETAENFGLSTLHQLRGRVGRGDIQSYCFLIATSKGEDAISRLKIITSSNDGFFIAEKDMKLRGRGGIFSKMQSGFEAFKFVNLEKDEEIFKMAKTDAKNIFEAKNIPGVQSLLKCFNYHLFIEYFKV